MTEELNGYSEVKQELEEIIGNCRKYFTILDSLSEVQKQFETSAQQITEQQTQAEGIVQTQLTDIQAQLNQFKQEQVQLRSEVSQLQAQLNNNNQEGRLILSQLNRIYGQNLEEYIHLQKLISEKQAIQWMLQTCIVLKEIHNLKPPLIHGNIQPSNILVRKEDNRVFLINLKTADKTTNNQISFNSYSAPEQKNGQLVPQSDLYSIGSTLIFLLTGKNPDFYAHHGQRSGFKLEEITAISPKLREVILKVTEYNPTERYQTAIELLRALSPCLS